MFTVISLLVVAALGYLVWQDRVNVIKAMKSDIAKVVELAKAEESSLATAVKEYLKTHL